MAKRIRKSDRATESEDLAESLALVSSMTSPSDVVPSPRFTKSAKGKRSKKEKKLIREAIAMLIARGYTDEEISESLDIKLADVVQLKNAMVRRFADQVKTSSVEEIYARYCLQQGGILRQLSVVTELFKGSKQFNALVGSLNSQSNIFDKMLKVGQDLGIIKKTAREVVIIGGREIGPDVAMSEIEEELEAEFEFVQNLMNKTSQAAGKGKIKIRKVRRMGGPSKKGGGKAAALAKRVEAASETLDAEFEVIDEDQKGDK